MKMGIRLFLIVWCAQLCFLGMAASDVVRDTTPAAYAQATPLNRVETKVQDIIRLVTNVASALLIGAVVMLGVKFWQGDPSVWRFALYVVLGGVLVVSAQQVVQWLQT